MAISVGKGHRHHARSGVAKVWALVPTRRTNKLHVALNGRDALPVLACRHRKKWPRMIGAIDIDIRRGDYFFAAIISSRAARKALDFSQFGQLPSLATVLPTM